MCDQCEKWYHFECMGEISPAKHIDEQNEALCKRCKDKESDLAPAASAPISATPYCAVAPTMRKTVETLIPVPTLTRMLEELSHVRFFC